MSFSCSNCGAPLQDQQPFCAQCGVQIDWNASPLPLVSMSTTGTSPSSKSQQSQIEAGGKKEVDGFSPIIWVFLIAVLLFVFEIFGALLFLITGDWSSPIRFWARMGILMGIAAAFSVIYILSVKAFDKLDEKTSGGLSEFLSRMYDLGLRIVAYLLAGAVIGIIIMSIVSIPLNLVFGSFDSPISNELFWIFVGVIAVITLVAMLFRDFLEKRNISKD